MKNIIIGLVLGLAVLIGGFYVLNSYIYNEKQGDAGPVAEETPDGLTGGGWTWLRTEHADGSSTDAPSGGRFVLSFDEEGMMASATDCNGYSGTYALDGAILNFGPMASTKMFCEGSMESEYAAQLARTTGFAIEGAVLRLLLDGGEAMIFTR